MLQIKKKLPKIEILQEPLYTTHLLKLLDKMYKYEMDSTRTLGATERTCDAGRTRDGRTDGRTEWNQYTLFMQLCVIRSYISIRLHALSGVIAFCPVYVSTYTDEGAPRLRPQKSSLLLQYGWPFVSELEPSIAIWLKYVAI